MNSRPEFLIIGVMGLGAVVGLFFAQTVAKPLPLQPIWPGFGVNIHFTDPVPGELNRLAEGGFQYIRMDFHWAGTERSKGDYDFSAYDRLLASMKSKGIRPLWIFDYGNALYQEGAPSNPEAVDAFAKWAAKAAEHFKGEEILWEIWNEPNLDMFWGPKASPENYLKLATATAKAVKSVDPDCRLVTGGLSGFDFNFYGRSLNAELLSYVDGVSVHPYRGGGPESVWNDYAKLRSIVQALAPAEKKSIPIICSEWGYSTFDGGVSEGRQALYLGKIWLVSAAFGVPVSIFYDWKDDGDNAKENEHRFGTVKQDLTSKPSFLAAKQLLSSFAGCTKFRREDTIDPLKWVITGVGPGKIVQAEWNQKLGDPIAYKKLSLGIRANKQIYDKMMSGGQSQLTIATQNIPVRITYGPPLNEFGWLAIVEKPFVKDQRVDFKYDRKSNGAKVTCFFTAKGLRSAENLAIEEDSVTISSMIDGKPIGKATLKKMELNPSNFQYVRFLNNEIQPGENIAGTKSIKIDYTFTKGWNYFGINPASELKVPVGAKKIHLWVKMDGSGNFLRSRYRDESGRTFQNNLGRLDDPDDRGGWRAVTIPLDGTGDVNAWGGTDGAMPQGQIVIDSLLLVDSATRENPRSGVLEIGSAAYEF